jgi:hypothetical protein
MIKKPRNQPFAPKSGASSQNGNKEEEKNKITDKRTNDQLNPVA